MKEPPYLAARSILDKPLETPSIELFTELKWMMFPERVVYQKAILMYKVMHNLTPPYLTNIFKFSSEVHDRSLRSTSENLLYVPKSNTELYRNSLAYSGSKIWNSIPDNIRNATCLQQFRHKYLKWAASMNGTRRSFHLYLGIELTFYRCIYLKMYSFYFLQILLYVCIYVCTC